MLSHEKRLETFSIAQRMSWAAERKTTRIEDMAYCLMGIFDINMPLIYGEGENAFLRLQEEIMKLSDDHSLFAWRSSDDRGGCLATSPASFRDSSNIIPSNTWAMSYDPTIVSSKGVHLNVPFMGIGRGRLGHAILNCCEHGREDERIAILLRDMSLTMDHLERVKSNEMVLVDFEAFASQYPIRRLCIQKSRVRSKRQKKRTKSKPEPRRSVETCDSLINAASPEILSRHLSDVSDLSELESPKSLLEAVRMGLEDDVWLFLTRQDIDVNEEDEKKQSALCYAAAKGKEEIVHMLISRPDVYIDGRDVDGRTPMWWAVKMGHKGVVKLLLETGKVDVNSTDNDGLPPLVLAVKARNAAVLKLVLGTGRINVELTDSDGATALSSACRASKRASSSAAMDQRIEVINLLLRLGKASPNARDKWGRTPLSLAAAALSEDYSGDIDQKVAVIKMLLELGKADANSRDTWGRTPLSWAAEVGEKADGACHLLMSAMIAQDTNLRREGESKLTMISEAIIAGDVALVTFSLKSGLSDLTPRTGYGRTLLITAVAGNRKQISGLPVEGNAAIIKALLAHTADVDLEDNHGITVLSCAIMARNITAIQLLLETGKVNINLKEVDGLTPLARAEQMGDEAVIEVLKTSGADFNPYNSRGRSLMKKAAAQFSRLT
jgi:ankyrin repeat protein